MKLCPPLEGVELRVMPSSVNSYAVLSDLVKMLTPPLSVGFMDLCGQRRREGEDTRRGGGESM